MTVKKKEKMKKRKNEKRLTISSIYIYFWHTSTFQLVLDIPAVVRGRGCPSPAPHG